MRNGTGSLLICCAAAILAAAPAGIAAPGTGTARAVAGGGPVTAAASLATAGIQEDFPAMCLDGDGTPWVAYVEWNGKADVLKVARKAGSGLKAIGTLAGPGIIHQPAIACDGKGVIWVVWSQVNSSNVMNLHARQVVDGKPQPKTVTLADSPAGDVFADAGTDRAGRVWVAWQSFRNGPGDIYARFCEGGKWSDEIRVTSHKAGDWEPRLAFGRQDGAAIAFDSSRNGNFDVYLARVGPDGSVKLKQITNTPLHEARPSVAAAPGGFWLAWERGGDRWGRNSRGVDGKAGLNAGKSVEVAYFDAGTGKVSPAADPTQAVRSAARAAARSAPAKKQRAEKPPARQRKKQPARGGATVNLPLVAVDGRGTPWLACRYYVGSFWRIALLKYDPAGKTWTQPVTLANSSFGQDRRCIAAGDGQGRLWLAWPSDRRKSKRAGKAGVYLARVDTAARLPAAGPAARLPAAKPRAAAAAREPRWGDDTPERPRADRHVWTVNGKEYSLYWGDFHRHTDVSNCRTNQDGCIVEQFRYAYDVGKLDFLGTSDHTDAGKPYDPYEWWCNQKLADVFQAPGFFNSFYVYEREQKWPWGHRNVVFTDRGGPVIYIKRALYKSMPWQAKLPAGGGDVNISPQELWKLLRACAMPVTVISHTGATGMGTDWDKYKQIDHTVENLVEIYQGARVSYEGTNTPQPTVGFPKGKQLKADAHGSVKTGQGFGKYNKGVYQNALRNGYNLGVFANSDHISTHTSFGGAYAESFTREGILEALNARRTIAATDKIFVEFSCSGHLLGRIFETSENPVLKVSVRGTAGLRQVTIVRNEADYKALPTSGANLDATFTDTKPLKGINRYYVRVVQADGNMAWTSPVWVTRKP